MKQKKNLLVGLTLGMLISGALAFVALPIGINVFSFLLGVILCLIFVLLVFSLFLLRNKQLGSNELSNKKSSIETTRKVNANSTVVRLVAFFMIVLLGLVGGFLFLKQKAFTKAQAQFENKIRKDQFEFSESVRVKSLAQLMGNIFDKIDEELKDNSQRTLSKETIGRIGALSHSYKPYRCLEGDSLSLKRKSPERGQLLLALSQMNIDTSSFNQIKLKTSFVGADLKDADLRNANLSGIDLSQANLEGADLSGANMIEVNLKEANLWGANLNKVNLKGANLWGANLAWAKLNESDLRECMMDGVDLTSAKLRAANLTGVKLQWADLTGAFLNEANLVNADLKGALFIKANLSDANLSKANLNFTNLSRTNLTQTNLALVNLDRTGFEIENWFEKLNECNVIGAKEIQTNYKVVVDKTGRSNFRVVKNVK